MLCPSCGHPESKVVDTRESADGLRIRRRRECEKCSDRFTTTESLELLDLVLLKRDGRREAYDREKLEAGLKRALEKRPFTQDQFQGLVGAIERDLQRSRRDALTTEQVGEIVLKHLQPFDEVAYIRFASVYKSFSDVASFRKELERLG